MQRLADASLVYVIFVLLAAGFTLACTMFIGKKALQLVTAFPAIMTHVFTHSTNVFRPGTGSMSNNMKQMWSAIMYEFADAGLISPRERPPATMAQFVSKHGTIAGKLLFEKTKRIAMIFAESMQGTMSKAYREEGIVGLVGVFSLILTTSGFTKKLISSSAASSYGKFDKIMNELYQGE